MPEYDEARVQRFFNSGPEEVEANREGHLGPTQCRSFRTTSRIWSAILLAWVCAMGFALYIQLNGSAWHGAGNLIATVLFIVVIGALPARVILVSARFLAKDLTITRYSGKVTVGAGWMTVGSIRLGIPQVYNGRAGQGPKLAPFVDTNLSYDVFAARGRALSMTLAP